MTVAGKIVVKKFKKHILIAPHANKDRPYRHLTEYFEANWFQTKKISFLIFSIEASVKSVSPDEAISDNNALITCILVRLHNLMSI